MALSSSTSDQVENASFACSIEHVHNLTVILPHRMQGMATSTDRLSQDRLLAKAVCQTAANDGKSAGLAHGEATTKAECRTASSFACADAQRMATPGIFTGLPPHCGPA